MRVALLKDPEIRARIEKPMPLPDVPPEEVIEGAAPEDPIVSAPPPAAQQEPQE